MARSKNAAKPRQVTVSVSSQVFALLSELAESGFAAKTEAAVAEEMIRKGLNADGLLSELVRRKIKKTRKS
jgi:hypothetical protein